MQKLFSQETRFKDEDGKDFPEWEENEFSDVFKTEPSKKHQITSANVQESGLISVIDQGKEFVSGYSNEISKVLHCEC